MNPKILRQLRAILADLYPDEASIRRVATDAGIMLARLTLTSNALNNWDAVFHEARKSHRFDALLETAQEEYLTNPVLSEACDAYRHAIKENKYNSHLARVAHEDVTQLVSEQVSTPQADKPATPSLVQATDTDKREEQQKQIEGAIRNHPDFLTILQSSDFTPKEERNGRELIVVRPKVAITCQLPLAISSGSCHIEFSDPFLRGLSISLEHNDVLKQLIIGRNTPLRWNARSFIRVSRDGMICLTIPPLDISLTEADSIDLCECVDKVIDAYIAAIMEAENALEAWNRPISRQYEDSNEYSYELLTVSNDTWQQIREYAKLSRESELEYRLSDGLPIYILSETGPIYRAGIAPKLSINDNRASMPDITLLYMNPYYKQEEWQELLRANHLWTVRYTKNWLLKKFLPQLQNPEARDRLERTANPNIFWRINEPHLFLHHIYELKAWGNAQLTKYPSELLFNYCEAFNQLLFKATIEDRYSNSLSAMGEYLLWSEGMIKNEPNPYDYATAYYDSWRTLSQDCREQLNDPKHLFSILSNYLVCLRQCEYINYDALEYLLRAQEILFNHTRINTTQSAIYKFKEALWPLFERASIETRCHYIDYID